MLWKCASFSSQTSNVQLRLLERKANPLWLPPSHVVCAWPAISCKRYTVSLVYCAIVVKMHTSNRFHPAYGCVLILVSVMYFNVEAKCPADLKQNKTCRRDLPRICPACIEVSWLIRPPFTCQNGNTTWYLGSIFLQTSHFEICINAAGAMFCCLHTVALSKVWSTQGRIGNN